MMQDEVTEVTEGLKFVEGCGYYFWLYSKCNGHLKAFKRNVIM
jgi:hypothetical protein